MSLKRQSLWSIAPLVVITAISFISAPLFYRYLGPERYALWFDVQTLTGSFGFMDLGFGMAVGRYIGVAIGRGDREAVGGYWATGNAVAIPLLTVMSLVFIAIGAWFGPTWFNVPAGSADATLLRWAFVAGGCGLFLNYYAQFWNMLSQAHLDFKFVSLLRISVSVLQILPAVWIARQTANPLLVILWYVAVGVLQLGAFVWHSRVKYQLDFSLHRASLARLREMASFSTKIFGTLIVNSLFGSIDRLVVGRFAPQAQYTNYCIANGAAGRLSSVSVAASGPIYYHTTHAVGSQASSPGRIYDEMFSLLLEWYGFAATWLVVWHPLVLHLWWGREAAAGHEAVALALIPFFPVLCVAFCFSAVATVSTSQLGPLNRAGTELGINLVLGLTTATAVLIGWFTAGMVGAAYGLLASRVVLVGQDLYVARLVGAKGWLALKNWGRLLVLSGTAAIFFLIYRRVGNRIGPALALAALHAFGIGAWLTHPYWRKWIGRGTAGAR